MQFASKYVYTEPSGQCQCHLVLNTICTQSEDICRDISLTLTKYALQKKFVEGLNTFDMLPRRRHIQFDQLAFMC